MQVGSAAGKPSSQNSAYTSRPPMSRRASGESARSRRSLASQVRHGLSAARERNPDTASLLTVDEITQEVENRRESFSLAGAGGGWVVDADRMTGDAAPAPGVMATSNAALCRIGGWIAASDPRVGAQAMADDMLTDMREGVGRITVPLRVVYGVDEKVLPAQRHAAIYARAYAKAPAAQLVPISSSRHFVMLDQPEALHREIELFLK